MRNFIIVILMLLPIVVHSQPQNYKVVADEGIFKKKMAATSVSTNTIKADFIQEKNLEMISEKIISKGIFRFQKPGKIRMEYREPFRYIMVINGNKVTISDEQKTNSFSAKSNKLFTTVNNIILDCVQGTALYNKDFDAKVFRSEQQYLMLLTPRKKDLQEFFEGIYVYLHLEDLKVLKMEMKEPSGDNTIITFLNQEINTKLPDADFIIK